MHWVHRNFVACCLRPLSYILRSEFISHSFITHDNISDFVSLGIISSALVAATLAVAIVSYIADSHCARGHTISTQSDPGRRYLRPDPPPHTDRQPHNLICLSAPPSSDPSTSNIYRLPPHSPPKFSRHDRAADTRLSPWSRRRLRLSKYDSPSPSSSSGDPPPAQTFAAVRNRLKMARPQWSEVC